MATYAFEYVNGGRNFGCMPWRDISDPNYMYNLRERNADDQASIELVKVDVRTGVEVDVNSWLWANVGDPGEIPASPAGNLAGSLTGDKLYATCGDVVGAGPIFDSFIVEFDKASLAITNSWQTANNNATGLFNGHTICNLDGSIVVHMGMNDLDIPDGFINLLNPSTDEYVTISLSSLGIVDSAIISRQSFNLNVAACFDNNDKLWFITQPIDTGGTLTGKSMLHKATLTAAPLGITINNSYEIDDDYHAYDYSPPTGLFTFGDSYGHKIFYYNPSTDRLILHSWWDAGDNDTAGIDESWLIEFNPSDGSVTRTANNLVQNCRFEYGRVDGNEGYYSGDYVVLGRRTLGFGDCTHLRVLQISAGTYEDHALTEFVDFDEPDDTNNWSLFFSEGSQLIYASDLGFLSNGATPFSEYLDGLFTIIPDEVEPDFVGGAGFQLEPVGCVISAQVFALEVRDLNCILELGPFRFVEQKESDETSMITTLVLGLTEADTGLLVEVDMALVSIITIDMATLVDVLGDDIYVDMGEGADNSDDFTLELLGNDDGSTYPGPPIEFKPEVLTPIEDRGSVKQYSPIGYSFIYHRLRLKATQVDEKFAVKFVDLSGQLTGRLF